VNQPSGAVERLDQIEDAIRFQQLQLAPHVAEVGCAGEHRDGVAARGQGGAHSRSLIQHVALVGRRVIGNRLVNNRDVHAFPCAPSETDRCRLKP